MQPQLAGLTGALGEYFTQLSGTAQARLGKTLGVAMALAQALKGVNIGEEGGIVGKDFEALGIELPNDK